MGQLYAAGGAVGEHHGAHALRGYGLPGRSGVLCTGRWSARGGIPTQSVGTMEPLMVLD